MTNLFFNLFNCFSVCFAYVVYFFFALGFCALLSLEDPSTANMTLEDFVGYFTCLICNSAGLNLSHRAKSNRTCSISGPSHYSFLSDYMWQKKFRK